ncbi:MAG TPA: hypothetical protein VE439_10950 [Anaerolineae bacterium]|jgi:hypothetical protein|nr:hypothetical protein [Anaerolineae bacterium]
MDKSAFHLHDKKTPPKLSDQSNKVVESDNLDSANTPPSHHALVDKKDNLLEVTAKNGLVVKITDEKMVTSVRGKDTEIPLSKVTKVILQKSALDVLRFETTVIMHLECGRIVTLKRLPNSKAEDMKSAILAAI